MAGFRWFQVVSGWFQLVSDGFRWFQMVSGGFRSFLVLVSTLNKTLCEKRKKIIWKQCKQSIRITLNEESHVLQFLAPK